MTSSNNRLSPQGQPAQSKQEEIDHDHAFAQLMEKVGMLIDNAKFAKRDWVHIEWHNISWARPGPNGRRVTTITNELREAIRVTLTARGFRVEWPLIRGKEFRTLVQWGA